MARLTLAMLVLAVPATASVAYVPRPEASAGPAPERVVVNDNRTPAGTLRGGVLTVRVEVRRSDWRPDGEDDPGIELLAFAEDGGPPRIPGPLIRVVEGTEIRASVRNPLPDETLVVHGLGARAAAPGGGDTIRVAPGATREVRFVAGAPGTYCYWGSTRDAASMAVRFRGRESQLYGALIIDPAGSEAPPRDRVLVIGVWSEVPLPQILDSSRTPLRMVINGKAWPHTERLAYTAGDTVRWRVVNASAAVHPMHLHGFYYRVDRRGDGARDSAYAPADAPLVVTERMGPGRTMSLTWVPVRPGNWLFHCHDNAHIQPSGPLGGAGEPAKAAPAHAGNHALRTMGGLVMGVQVRPRPGMATTADPRPRRRLRLVARVDSGGTPGEPAYAFALEDGSSPRAPAPASVPGPRIVLKRGEPVSITVVNELPEVTSVHWHGIELESYFDGVADFAGSAGRLAPAIAPRDSFEARFTPPRAGTFIYHTHMEELRQQRAGLSGALVVIDPEATFDPATDIVLLVSTPRRDADRDRAFLNGSTSPAPLELRTGTRYRLRLINIHTYRPSLRIELSQDSTLLRWRALAKDGADLPPSRATIARSSIQIGNGETYDFEFVPAAPGALHVDVRTGVGELLVSMPVRVR
ncbi:MAG TPA: multicopper oxidase domain-containing protein [Longimicrobiales bacterium]|nr:multicopper oxidase domain-containing protein [Longimicrobiales bacterium]